MADSIAMENYVQVMKGIYKYILHANNIALILTGKLLLAHPGEGRLVPAELEKQLEENVRVRFVLLVRYSTLFTKKIFPSSKKCKCG